MRKEILFAILAGGLFGLVIAFGIWRANLSIKSNKEQATESAVTPAETPSSPEQIGITVYKPDNNQVVSTSPALVSGVTTPKALIAISGEEKDYLFQADEKGAFEQEIDLVSGVNQIVITSFDNQGNSSEEKLILVYSSQFEEK